MAQGTALRHDDLRPGTAAGDRPAARSRACHCGSTGSAHIPASGSSPATATAAIISPDTGRSVGTVYRDLSFDKRFSTLGRYAEKMNALGLAISSLPGMEMDTKSTIPGYPSYSGVFLDGKYMTLREIGNVLAGYNAAGNLKSFDYFRRVSGALHAAGARGAFMAATFGTSYGRPPNYGEVDYQRARIKYGYELGGEKVHSWQGR